MPWRVESGQALRQPVRCRNVGGDDARYGLRHREIPRQRTGERHRSPFRPCDRPAIRCGDDRSDRNRHRTALRGAADRPQARGEDPRELGAAEGDQERDAVSPKLRRKHGLCRQDLPRVRLGEYRQGSGESLPPRRRHLGHRLQDCRRHRRQDGLREERCPPVPERDSIHARPTLGRGTRLCRTGTTRASGLHAARSRRGTRLRSVGADDPLRGVDNGAGGDLPAGVLSCGVRRGTAAERARGECGPHVVHYGA